MESIRSRNKFKLKKYTNERVLNMHNKVTYKKVPIIRMGNLITFCLGGKGSKSGVCLDPTSPETNQMFKS